MSSRLHALNRQRTPRYDDSSEVEVIEDSEPERAEKREYARIEKRRQQGAVPISSKPKSNASPTLSWTTNTNIPTQSTSGASSSAVSSKPPNDASQILPALGNPSSASITLSAPVRQVAPPPWVVCKDPPAPASPTRRSPKMPQRTKRSSQPSPVKQLDVNSFVFQKRTGGARSTSYSTSRSASSSKLTDPETAGSSKATPVPSAKPPVPSKSFCLGATNGSSSPDSTFSSEQITSLTSCVVCSNSWTVRKQAKSKWSHIISCARKNGCGNEALCMKIIAAIVEASEEKARNVAKGKGKDKNKEPVAAQSLLAHTVQERAPPKRRGRRKESGPSSLQPLEEAQRVILQRSILLLGEDLPHQDENKPRSVAPTQQEESEDESSMPATQAFAPSKIGGHSKFFGSSASILNTDSASGLLYADEPRSFFGNFNAGSRATSPQSSVIEDYGIHDSPPPSPPDSQIPFFDSSIISINSSNNDPTSSEVELLDDRVRSSTRSDSSASVLVLGSPVQEYVSPVPDPRSLDDGTGWDSQEGVYMWEDYAERPFSPTDELAEGLLGLTIRESQDASTGVEPHGRSPIRASPPRDSQPFNKPHSPLSSPDRPLALKAHSKTCIEHSSSPDRPLAAIPTTKTKLKSKGKAKEPTSPPAPKRRTKKKTAIYAPENAHEEEETSTSENVDERLLAMITSNETLYLRILRYEPIKFEDLFEMAVANGVPKHGLQIKLKSFLDSQCINFYSGDNIGRKKRHP